MQDIKRKNLVCTIGLPFSGKSTYVRDRLAEGWEVISRDQILEQLLKSDEYIHAVQNAFNEERPVSQEQVFSIKNRVATLMLGEKVRAAVRNSNSERIVFDGTNLQRKMRAEILKLRNDGLSVEAVVFAVPPEKIVERAQRAWERGERDGSFNQGAFGNLVRMAQMAEDILPEEGFDRISIIPFMEQENYRVETKEKKLR